MKDRQEKEEEETDRDRVKYAHNLLDNKSGFEQ